MTIPAKHPDSPQQIETFLSECGRLYPRLFPRDDYRFAGIRQRHITAEDISLFCAIKSPFFIAWHSAVSGGQQTSPPQIDDAEYNALLYVLHVPPARTRRLLKKGIETFHLAVAEFARQHNAQSRIAACREAMRRFIEITLPAIQTHHEAASIVLLKIQQLKEAQRE